MKDIIGVRSFIYILFIVAMINTTIRLNHFIRSTATTTIFVSNPLLNYKSIESSPPSSSVESSLLPHFYKKSFSSDVGIPLNQKKCVPCEGGIPPLTGDQITPFLDNINKDWKLFENNKKISRKWRLPFPESIKFLNKINEIAQEEGHHPDISISSYWNLDISLYTHSVNGLTENDFILASKIDSIFEQLPLPNRFKQQQQQQQQQQK
eukprot:gene7530-9253_t